MSVKALFAIVLAAALAGIGVHLAGGPNIAGATTTATRTATPTPAGFSHPLVFPPVNTNANVSIGIDEACVQILDGPCTNMWTYGGTYPGLTIRRPTGQRTYVTFTNNLGPGAGEMTVHNHGNHSSAETTASQTLCLFRLEDRGRIPTKGLKKVTTSEGRCSFITTTAWTLPVATCGWVLLECTLWMIPPIRRRFPQASSICLWRSLTGSSMLKNQIPYVFNPNGVTGDKFLVNGVYQPYLEVGDRKYRFRILNASNFRTYFLELSNGDSFIQIGTESGLLPVPVTRTGMRMGPAERLDVVVNFAGELGQNIYLVDALTGTQLLEFRVTQHVTDDSSIPATLRPLPDIGEPSVTRNWSFDQTGRPLDDQWTEIRSKPCRCQAGTRHDRKVGVHKSYGTATHGAYP